MNNQFEQFHFNQLMIMPPKKEPHPPKAKFNKNQGANNRTRVQSCQEAGPCSSPNGVEF